MKRINSIKQENLNANLIIMVMLSLLIQIISVLKTSIVASSFGASDEMDAYNLANNIVLFVFSFVTASISTIIIPEYANKRNKKSVNTFITVIYGAMIIVITLLILLRMPIADMLSDRSNSFTKLVANILVVLLTTQFLASISNITVAYFQCEGRYNTPKIIGFAVQVMTLFALIIFNKINVFQYTLIVSASLVMNFALDTVIAIKFGWRYRPTLLFDEETKSLFKRFLPMVLSTGAYKLSMMIDTILSSFLDTGKLSILSYTTQISSMVDTVIIGNLTLYLYPKLAKKVSTGGYQKNFWQSTQFFHLIVCLVSAGFLNVGYEGISMFFQHGVFTTRDSKMVFIGVAIYIIGHQTGVVRDLIYRYFYAIGDTETPAQNSITVSILNVVLSIILVWGIGFYGIIIGTILASFFSTVIILIRFGRKIGFEEKPSKIFGGYLISTLIFVATVGVVYLTKYFIPFSNNLVSIFVYGFETVVIFVSFSLLFNRNILLGVRDL